MKIIKTIVQIICLGTIMVFLTFSYFSLAEGNMKKFAFNTIILMALTLGFWAVYLI